MWSGKVHGEYGAGTMYTVSLKYILDKLVGNLGGCMPGMP